MSPAAVAVLLAALAGLCLPRPGRATRLTRVMGAGVPGGREDTAGRGSWGRDVVIGPLLAVGAAAVAVASGSSVLGLLLGAAAISADRGWRARRRRRAATRRRAALIELCQALASELSSGARPRVALAAATAGLPDFEHLRAVADVPHGDIVSALTATAARPGAEALRRLAACWQVSERSGGVLAPSIARLAATLREDEQVRREVAAQLAGPRATAVLLALLPAFGLLMGTAMGADPAAVLLGPPVGKVCLVVGAALEGVGLLWTGWIVRRAEPP